MLSQPTRRLETEAGNAAGDQIGAVPPQRHVGQLAEPDAAVAVRQQHQLADMTGGLHQPECVRDLAKAKAAMRQRPDRPLRQRRRYLAQQVAGEIGALYRQLIHIDREIGNVLAQRPQMNAPVEVEVALAQLEEAAERLQYAEALFHRLAA